MNCRRTTIIRAAWAAAIVVLVSLGGCNNSLGGFSGAVGNTPPTNPETTYKVLGTVGTPFTLTLTDTVASWVIPGTIPLNIVLLNAATPVKLVATKLANNSNLMSLEIVSGFVVQGVSSTSAPFGVASLQYGGTIAGIALGADPDVRIYVNGPFGIRFNGLVEDDQVGYIVQQRVPCVFLFQDPNSAIDGTFNELEGQGPFNINLTLNGVVVASARGGPTLTIKQP